MEEPKMYVIKLYQGELRGAGIYYEIEDEAREGFEQIKGRLGNPHIDFRFSIVLGGQEVGETIFKLGEFDWVELVKLDIADEELLDSYKLEAE